MGILKMEQWGENAEWDCFKEFWEWRAVMILPLIYFALFLLFIKKKKKKKKTTKFYWSVQLVHFFILLVCYLINSAVGVSRATQEKTTCNKFRVWSARIKSSTAAYTWRIWCRQNKTSGRLSKVCSLVRPAVWCHFKMLVK